MELPAPRGPVSAAVIGVLSGRDPAILAGLVVAAGDPVRDDDLQLALFVCYELHYRGWDGVDDRWEWNPGLLAARGRIEAVFEAALRSTVGEIKTPDPRDVPKLLTEIVQDEGPPLSAYLSSRADLGQFREFVAQRSVYHLREADPHTFAIPRLAGRPKAALVEIQQDEYGNGDPERMHQELFRATMRWFGLDLTYGAFVGTASALTLAINNLMSLFGLHRRLRGALIGQLAAFEMTSSLPNRAYGNGLRRLGGTPDATLFYDEHVIADAVHEQIAAHDLCGSFAAAEPEAAAEILFGARCAMLLDAYWAEEMLGRFQV
ncbi:iron-containing redox enzyme family protein [Actinoplanes sp. NPDC026619]|uniref:iron-containing redox enzyme family protein n=1 Tax=Actinoplanes sp. NPDC026619 TaxID=3155798 RepID=UPI0033D73384